MDRHRAADRSSKNGDSNLAGPARSVKHRPDSRPSGPPSWSSFEPRHSRSFRRRSSTPSRSWPDGLDSFQRVGPGLDQSAGRALDRRRDRDLRACSVAEQRGLFVLRRTTLNPVGQPALFVASGAYAWTRNPMYVGVTLVYLGAALALGPGSDARAHCPALGGGELDPHPVRGSASAHHVREGL